MTEKSYGETYWDVYMAVLRDESMPGVAMTFADLRQPDLREAVEAGAQAVAERVRGEQQQPYPHPDGDFTVIGPECFAAADGSVLSWRGENYVPQPEPKDAPRFALVEQMGYRSTVASVREVTFCGAPMLEVTDLREGGVHLISPASLYEVTWLTEEQARARAKPWTATPITAGQQLAYDEDAEADELAAEDAPRHDDDDPAERDDVLRMRAEMAREAGDDSVGADL